MTRIVFLFLFLLLSVYSQPSLADVCDYKPSSIASTVIGGSAGVIATTGIGMKAAGIYTITHASSGAAMLGSTAAGASAAGTTGIIAGTAGFFGTVGTALISPFVIVPLAVLAVGVGAYEGGCYLTSE